MKFCLIYQPPSPNAQSPIRVVEQTTARDVAWINRYLDREYVRRLADRTLRTYAHNLLHFVRWWESIHHTGDIVPANLSESTLLDYVRFQSSQQPRPASSTINDRVAVADRALHHSFPEAPCQIARGFHQVFLHRRPMGLGRPRLALSRLRVKVPKLNIVPLSVNEVARFWSSFHTCRDLAIVALMLLHGLRSAEVLALNLDDLLLSEAQLRVRGNRYHRRTTGIPLANPHRFRHTFACDMVRAGMSLPALMQLMGHADIQTTLRYVQVTPQDVYLEYARAVAQRLHLLPKIS